MCTSAAQHDSQMMVCYPCLTETPTKREAVTWQISRYRCRSQQRYTTGPSDDGKQNRKHTRVTEAENAARIRGQGWWGMNFEEIYISKLTPLRLSAEQWIESTLQVVLKLVKGKTKDMTKKTCFFFVDHTPKVDGKGSDSMKSKHGHRIPLQ